MNLLEKILLIKRHELKATLVSFAFVFVLMAAYYILRPVRDAMASDWTDAEVSLLWTLNFFASAAIVALYGAAVSKIKFQSLVPGVYAFFGLTFLAFYAAINLFDERTLIDKTFYLWVSVFSLFHISVFWSFMSDIYNKQQATRLFGFIASGASAGALLGPSIPALFAGRLGTDTLLLIAALMLMFPVFFTVYLSKLKSTELQNEQVHADLSAARIGGKPFAGFKLFLSNPYLLAIGVFILLYTSISSFIYFEQKNLLAVYDRETRTQILGSLDWAVNILTFIIAIFGTSRLATKFGMPTTLAIVPVFIIGGMLILAAAPIISVILGLQVARRAGNYAITRPGREILFTNVDRETRFKAKPVIDIVVYRGGDMLNAWAFTGLTARLGLGLGAVAVVGAVIASIWAITGVYLGRKFNNLSDVS
ncbi:MAG: MFS transporter [Gammaproteobacteria bacterium]|nr:MFS transporter [Gammaproteobacteria bacterium]